MKNGGFNACLLGICSVIWAHLTLSCGSFLIVPMLPIFIAFPVRFRFIYDRIFVGPLHSALGVSVSNIIFIHIFFNRYIHTYFINSYVYTLFFITKIHHDKLSFKFSFDIFICWFLITHNIIHKRSTPIINFINSYVYTLFFHHQNPSW